MLDRPLGELGGASLVHVMVDPSKAQVSLRNAPLSGSRPPNRITFFRTLSHTMISPQRGVGWPTAGSGAHPSEALKTLVTGVALQARNATMTPRTPSKAYTWPGLRYSGPEPDLDHDSDPAGGTTTDEAAAAGGAGTTATEAANTNPPTIADTIRPIAPSGTHPSMAAFLPMTDYERIRYEVPAPGVGRITLARSDKANAQDRKM